MNRFMLLSVFSFLLCIGTVSASRVNRRISDLRQDQTKLSDLFVKLEARVIALENIIKALLQGKDIEQLKKDMTEVQAYIKTLETEPIS